MTDVSCVTCGNCSAEAWGYSRQELTEDGWQFKHARKAPFPLCPDCARWFEESRRLDRLLALEPATTA